MTAVSLCLVWMSEIENAAYKHRDRPIFFIFSNMSTFRQPGYSIFAQENTCVNRDKQFCLFQSYRKINKIFIGWAKLVVDLYNPLNDRFFFSYLTDDDELFHDYQLLKLVHNEQIVHVFHVHQDQFHPYGPVHLVHHVF